MFEKLLSIITPASPGIFDDIVGYDSIKKAFINSLSSQKPVHLLLDGPPGIGKTRFLRDIKKKFGDKCLYFEATNMTKAGFTKKVFEQRPRYICIDEIEKIPKSEMNALLSLMQDGRISETKVKATREITDMKVWVFATSNNSGKLDSALLSRFFNISMDQYSKQEFTQTAIKVLSNKSVSQEFLRYASEQVYEKLSEPNIRDVEQLCSMTRTTEDFDEMLVLKMKNRGKMI